MFTSAARIGSCVSLALLVGACATSPDTSRSGLHLSPAFPGAGIESRASGTLETIYFDFGSAGLTEAARARLDAAAETIRMTPLATFAVTGHTDAVGTAEANRKLGLARAEAALDYLVAAGVAEERLIALLSEGEETLAVASDGAEDLNRRVTVALYVPPGEDEDGEGGGFVMAAASVADGSGPASPGTAPETGAPGDDGPGDDPGGDAPDDTGGDAPDDTGGDTPGDTGSSDGPSDTGGNDTSTSDDKGGRGKDSPDHMDSGKGNGGNDGGDPGKSGGRNKAGEDD